MRTKALLLTVAVLVLTSCGSGGSGGSGPVPGATSPAADEPVGGVDLDDYEFEDLTGQDEVVIQARDNTFVPAHVEISPGTRVVFRNVGRTEHNVIPAEDGAFEPIEADDLVPKAEIEMTFDIEGTHPFPYYCSLHGTPTKGMVGAVRVVAD